MKKRMLILLAVLLWVGCAGCGGEETPSPEPFPTFSYTHYASGGTQEPYTAVILHEQSNSTFTSYQVAYLSCTCRDPLVNYCSVCYVELLNARPSAEEAAIRAISFGQNRGLWGDSNPNYYIAEYTEAYMDEHLVQPLAGASKADFDAWEGYGTQPPQVDADAISGATVSASNLASMLRGLFAYHAEHYYS